MLILSRKVNEQIHIGKDITIKVIDLQGGKVRLAIQAPPEVSIRRSELPPRTDHEDQPAKN